MSDLRPFALIRDGDQWIRGSFAHTFLDYHDGVVGLAWSTPSLETGTPTPRLGAGLAFDNECRLYHSVPEAGDVQLVRWSARDPHAPAEGAGAPVHVFASLGDDPLGDFDSAETAPVLGAPRGLAVDENDRLLVADTGRDQVLVFDLWSRRLLRRIALPGAQPSDLASHGALVWCVLAASGRVVQISAGGGPEDVALPDGCTDASRVAVSPDGRVAVLSDAGTAQAHVWLLAARGAPADDFVEPFAGDVEWESSAVLVVARKAGADFLRFRVDASARELVGPLRARGYDGLGIVRTPDRLTTSRECHCGGGCQCEGASYRIGYWTARGLRLAVPARLTYARTGRVTTYRLDSGEYQTQWGRVFLDACIPDGAGVRLSAIALDEIDEAADDLPMPRIAPENVERVTIMRPDLSPPMPPASRAPGADPLPGRVHLRESGRELPWTQPASDDPFRTYEGWIDAPAGRYLWLTLELTGNTRVTPRVRCIRAEHPAHDYLRRLPKLFSRDEQQASFLRRYLAMFEGFLGELDARAVERDILLTPSAAPDEVLPWLAGFLGLVLDERWAQAPRPGGGTVDARRAIIAEAAWLFRFRGTVRGLRRFLALYAGVDVVLLEHFRMRGRMGALLGDPLAASADAHAHRFTVLIPASLTEEQLDVVRRILEVHRPAHTIFDVCTVGAGMRLGRGLHVGISSMVGPTGGFSTVRLGSNALGRGAIVGRPTGAATVQASRLGLTTEMR